MKKILLVLGMVLSLSVVTACGGSDTTSVQGNMSADEANSIAQDYVSQLQEVVMYANMMGVGVDELITDKSVVDSVNSFASALDEIGDIVEVKDATGNDNNGTITITCTIVGSLRNATQVVVLDSATRGLVTSTTNVDYPLGELVKQAGLNTILGMGTVFLVLIILLIVISLFRFIPDPSQKKAKAPAAVASVDNAVAQIIENEEQQDDTELIAVIAAAIAAAEGSASTDGYVVRSIRRRF